MQDKILLVLGVCNLFYCEFFFVLPFWPGLPGRRDVASQWDYPGKIKDK